MIIPNYLSQQISEARTLLNDILKKVQNDTFDYDEFQIFRLENYREYLEKIKATEFEKLIIETKNLNLNREIFNGLLSNIEDYTVLYLKIKNKTDAFDINKLYDVYLNNSFEKEIEIVKNDILEVEDEKNPLPKFEKEKLLKEFKEIIRSIQEKRDNHIKISDWFFINYYEKFYEELKALEFLINQYFPENKLEINEDLFDRNLINALYNICLNECILKPENISFEDFYLILNKRQPKQIGVNSIEKKTQFSFPIKNLSKRIEDKNQRKNWIQFVSIQFGLSVNSVNSHGDTKDESTEIFYDLFGIKVKV